MSTEFQQNGSQHLLRVPYFRIAAISIIFVIFVIFIFNSLTKELLKSIETARRASLTQLVYLARNGVEPVVERVRSSTISRQEGVLEIRRIVRRMVYEDQYGKNYIFMSAYDGTMLVQPYEPKKELTSQWNLKDSYGTFIIQELIRTARSHVKGGFVRYHYPLPNSLEPQEKLAFVIGIPELNCYIGTGMYLQAFHKEQQSIIQWAQYSSIIFVALVALLALLALREMLARNHALYAEIQKVENARKELRELEEKYRSIFNNVVEGIFQSTPDGKFLTVNPALAKICGYASPEEMIALVNDISHQLYAYPHQREKIMSILDKQERVDNFEIEILRKGGTILWASLNARAVYDNKGDICYYEGTFNDISERKRAEGEKQALEERLVQADKMESIGTLAGGIAHDFNNLLAGIQGYASMTLMNLKQNDPNYERLKRIEEQVRSGADLTQQLLGFARGGRYEIKPSDMNEILEKTSSMFGRTKKEITIHRKSGSDLWSVEVDRGQMEQVFLNLYVNAWQAMPGGGNIYLETHNEVLNNEQTFPYAVKQGKYVKITVTDTGTGMDEKTKEKIFEPFFTTKGMGKGTGLGLASAYGIIKGHGGIINVYSEPGHGSTFTIYLPASEKEVKAEEIPTEKIVMGTEAILLIDDEKTVMEVNKELLESMGYTIYAAGSGQEGLAVYMEKKDNIDLVILDMIMPGIAGSDTFDRLREINPNIKVLLSSGYSLTGKAQAIMDRGCNGFLQKPFNLEELSRKVREMFG